MTASIRVDRAAWLASTAPTLASTSPTNGDSSSNNADVRSSCNLVARPCSAAEAIYPKWRRRALDSSETLRPFSGAGLGVAKTFQAASQTFLGKMHRPLVSRASHVDLAATKGAICRATLSKTTGHRHRIIACPQRRHAPDRIRVSGATAPRSRLHNSQRPSPPLVRNSG